MNKEVCLRIFERYISGEASQDEIARLKRWLENDRDLNNWLEDRIANSPEDISQEIKMRMWENIRFQTDYNPVIHAASAQKHKGLNFYLKKISNIAAMLLPVVIILGIALYPKSQTGLFEVIADKGEKANLTLPEGSKVVINSDSKIVYRNDYNQKGRYVKLSGEAYFEVTPHPENPFIVECGEIKVRVLGTSFGIKTYENEDDISIVLNSGKIQLITPKEEIEMAPDDRIVYNKATKTTISERVNANDYTDWKQNRLRFENESLETIMKTISRMHNIDIIFEDPRLKSQRFTGTIDNTSIKNVLDAIKLTSLTNYKSEGGVVYLYK